MRKENILIIAGIVVSIVISIIAICIAAPRSIQHDFDYQGIIVGVLSLLVTILIGWQIYNVIEAKSSIESFAEKIKEIDSVKQDYNTLKIFTEAQICHLAGHSFVIQGRFIDAVDAIIEALVRYAQIETYSQTPDNIKGCLYNCGCVLFDLQIHSGDAEEAKLYKKTLDKLKNTPPRFTSPEWNRGVQWIFEFMLKRQDNVCEELTENQRKELSIFTNEYQDVD